MLRTHDSYPQAQSTVDKLVKADFPVEKVSIVGSDLKTVERVTGKLSWGRAAGAGATSGAWFGGIFGILLFLITGGADGSTIFVLAAVLIGAGVGMLLGLATYAIGRRRRDFSSTTQVVASSYQVIVASEVALQAQEALARPAE